MLALLCERPAHGWALARQLSPTGELGSIWSLTRPLVYRSLEILEERGLIVPAGQRAGRRAGRTGRSSGPPRPATPPSPSGSSEPVEHVREGRSLLLLKLVFAQRNCVDPRPMLLAQQAGARRVDRLARGARRRERRRRARSSSASGSSPHARSTASSTVCFDELEPVAQRPEHDPSRRAVRPVLSAQWALTRKGWELREGPLS